MLTEGGDLSTESDCVQTMMGQNHEDEDESHL
jgi:hypothetical protein